MSHPSQPYVYTRLKIEISIEYQIIEKVICRIWGRVTPGRLPAQLVAHTLFYFTQQGDLVFDPMAGGGIVPDTCLAFNRKCSKTMIIRLTPMPPNLEIVHGI